VASERETSGLGGRRCFVTPLGDVGLHLLPPDDPNLGWHAFAFEVSGEVVEGLEAGVRGLRPAVGRKMEGELSRTLVSASGARAEVCTTVRSLLLAAQSFDVPTPGSCRHSGYGLDITLDVRNRLTSP